MQVFFMHVFVDKGIEIIYIAPGATGSRIMCDVTKKEVALEAHESEAEEHKTPPDNPRRAQEGYLASYR
jgi:hypothetical protein